MNGTAPAPLVTLTDLLANASWARRLAGSLVRDRDDAEDLVQETFVAAWRTQPADDRDLRPWFARVLRNRAHNHARDQQRRAARHQAAGTLDETAAPGADELLDHLQAQQLLAELVSNLGEPTRRTLLLRYYEGMSSEEIARAMAAPAGTVRRRLKTGLEQLRTQLDARHRGRREDWLRALVPLAPGAWGTAGDGGTSGKASSGGAEAATQPGTPAAGPRSVAPAQPRLVGRNFVLAAAGALVVSAVLVAAVVAGGGRTSARLGDETAGTASASAGRGHAPPPRFRSAAGGPGAPLAAALPATFDSCRDQLGARRRDLVEAERDYRKTALPQTLYAEGAPHPRAREVLQPELDRAMKVGDIPAPSFSLECRSLVCRMLVLVPEGPREKTYAWQRQIQRDEPLKKLTPGMGFRAGAPTKDPLSGLALTEVTVLLRLADDLATPLPPETSPAVVTTIPTDLRTCHAQLTAVERRLAHVRMVIERDMHADERFARGQPNPALAQQVQAVINRVLSQGPTKWTATVACRGRTCRVDVPSKPGDWESVNRWRQQLNTDPEFARLQDGGSFGREAYYQIADPTRPWGMSILRALADRTEQSPAFGRCEARFATPGGLEIRYSLPDAERDDGLDGDGDTSAGDDSARKRITFRIGGVLAGTPLAKCLEGEVIAPALAETAVPERVRGATLYRRFTFPRSTATPAAKR
jgi:RNA polymerase sigma-70 factor (ECF subfamily)